MRANAQGSQPLPALRVPANDDNFATRQPQYLRAEQAELAIANDRDAIGGPDVGTFENCQRRRQRLGEYRRIVCDAARYGVQAIDGERKSFGHRTIATKDAKRRALRAVLAITSSAGRTRAARRIDLADHTLPTPNRIGTSNHRADKFVAGDAVEPLIPTCDFKIGVTDADKLRRDQRLAGPQHRLGVIGGNVEHPVEDQCLHTLDSLFGSDRTPRYSVAQNTRTGVFTWYVLYYTCLSVRNTEAIRFMTLKVLFLGTPELALLPLARLAADARYTLVGVVTQPDRAGGRSASPQPPPVKRWLAEHAPDVPLFQPETLRDAATVTALAVLRPDVGVVAAYGEILRRDVLAIPPLGYLNIHPSLLPLYRGPAPLVGAILAGDAEAGVTIMQLGRRMDAGPILHQQRVLLASDARAGATTHDLFVHGADQLLETLAAYAAGQITPQAQDENAATYTRLLRKDDGQIDWTTSAVQIERMTRAYDPWPGALTSFRGQPLRIIAARVGSATASPGTLLATGDGLAVGTGTTLLELLEIQPAGRRAIDAAAWRRGLRDLEGATLGTR